MVCVVDNVEEIQEEITRTRMNIMQSIVNSQSSWDKLIELIKKRTI